MPSLPALPIDQRRVNGGTIIPNYNRLCCPLDSGLEISSIANMIEEEFLSMLAELLRTLS